MNASAALTQLHRLSCLVGNTPLLAVDFKYKGLQRRIYAKAENLNMTGSIKDRMAYYILKEAYAEGILQPDNLIVEATSGNTGISFSALGRSLGHPVTIFMPDWMSAERINLIKSLGAKVHLVSREEGGFIGSINLAEELAKTVAGAFLPKQFSNQHNITAHYETTGPEIWWQLKFRDICPDGTIMGVGRFLKETHPDVKIHPLEPLNSPIFTHGHNTGKHRIQGISDEFIPPILDLSSLDKIVSVDDGDAIIMSQKLASELGMGVGISSGANFIGALKIQTEMGTDANVVTVFPDDNKKYLSTDLLKEEPVKAEFVTPDIELQSVRALKQVCQTCCDPIDCMESQYYETAKKIPLPECVRRI